ncbi:MAG: HNH endonuclease [Treponema sp.]|nr:HNH endonuclease [Treponema sp.]
MAEAFIPNPDNLETVNHKDENKTNNNVENLEWMDLADNIRYGTGIERSRKKVRKRIMCVETGEIFDSITIAANELHLYQGNISRVVDTDKTTGKMHFVSVKKEDK